MASLIAKSEGHADKNGTLISQNPLKYQIDFGQPEASNVVWNIIYDNGEGCSGETQYTVNGTGSCTNVSISCVPTEKQLQDGSAATVVTVTSNGNACTRKFYCEQETGHPQHNSGYEFTAHTAGTYVFRSVDDTGKTCTFLVTQPATCEITSISISPTSDEISDTHTVATTRVVVQGTEQCNKTWKAWKLVNSDHGWTRDPSYTPVTGDTNTDFQTSIAGRYSIFAVEDESVEDTFIVNSAPTFNTYFEVDVNSSSGGNRVCYDSSTDWAEYVDTQRVMVSCDYQGQLSISITGLTNPNWTGEYYEWRLDDTNGIASAPGWSHEGTMYSYKFEKPPYDPGSGIYWQNTTTITNVNGGTISLSLYARHGNTC